MPTFVDQRAVGVGHEGAVGVVAAQFQHVALADERLAAGEHEEMGAQGLRLTHDALHLKVRKVRAVAVFRGPAALALQVARRRGIEQDDPRDVAVVFAALVVTEPPLAS